MKKLLITLLISISLCIPAFVSAQEIQPAEDTNTAIPIYFFVDEEENVLAVAPISEELFLWYYLYQGDTGALYANPHALTLTSTTASTAAYTYDNNGNVTSYGDWSNVWDYMNRLLQSVNSVEGTTTTYAYDQSGQRVLKTVDGVESIYPNKYYTIEDGTVKKHIFAGGTEIASVEGVTTTYHHTDHLSGSSVETDHEGYVIEVLDYYPFGSTRIDEQYTTYENDKKFTGHMYDDSTDLYYMGARYQDPGVGRFVSQDPVVRDNPEKHLNDPQGLSFYAYARNNPLYYMDPNGEDFRSFITSPAFNSGLQTTQRYTNTVGNLLSFGQFSEGFRNAGNAGARLSQEGVNPVSTLHSAGELGFGIGRTALGGVATGGTLGELKLLAGSLFSREAQSTIQANKVAGDAFEQKTLEHLQKTNSSFVDQVTLKTRSGVRTRVDIIGRDSSGVCIVECKSSATAPLTRNQSLAFPEIEKYGATVLGKGKTGFSGGTSIEPTKVQIIRPER